MVRKGSWLWKEAWLETELGEERIMVRKGKQNFIFIATTTNIDIIINVSKYNKLVRTSCSLVQDAVRLTNKKERIMVKEGAW